MGRIYDNRTTIRFESGEDPVRRLGDAFGRMVEQVTVSLEHHSGVRVPQTARDSCPPLFYVENFQLITSSDFL